MFLIQEIDKVTESINFKNILYNFYTKAVES